MTAEQDLACHSLHFRKGCCEGVQALRCCLARAQGVEEVATQNTVLNAKAVLKGLAKCLDTAMIAEVEVVAAKFSLEDGAVKVIKRGWYSANARSFFYE